MSSTILPDQRSPLSPDSPLVFLTLPEVEIGPLAQSHGAVTVEASQLVDPVVRRRLRAEARPIWVDFDQAGSPKLRRAYLGPLTTTANSIAVSASELDRILASPSAGPRPERAETVAFSDGRSYEIVVGYGAANRLAELVPSRCKRVAVVTQEGVGFEVDSGKQQKVFTVPAGESAKRLEVVAELASAFAQWGMTRADLVVSVGGGVVSDVAGFVASTYHRGIPVIHVSTTLLGQIDAAIGGKCGVNLPEGKNLVGSFWQPTAVLCPLEALDTLPDAEFVAGMGELAKYHFLGGGDLDRLPLSERVVASARIKAQVVSGDEREGGRRAILNYGHTLGHALETASNYSLRHGEAVAVGLVYAAELAHRLGRIDADRVAEHRRVVHAYGLDCTIASSYDPKELISLFSRDKKALDGVTFVLDGPVGVEVVKVTDTTAMAEALAAITES